MTEPLIDLLAEVWDSLIDLGSGLDEAEWKRPTALPGWTVQDNLSHIIGIERMMQGDPTPDNQPARTDHIANPVGEMNEHWVEHYRHLTGAELLEVFRHVRDRRIDELSALPPAAFDEVGPTPVGQAPFRTFVAVRIMDSWVHEQDMRRALGRPGHLRGPAADLSVERLVSAMPFVVGKQAGAPDGSSVVVRIARPASPADGIDADSRVVAVVVGGRAALVDTPPGHPTTELDLDLATFVALTNGRQDPAAALDAGQVAVAGDVELGRRVVQRMSFMS